MLVSDHQRPTVLVVDDVPANLSLLSQLLRDDYRVKVAKSGVKALELANAAPPDLILLDIMMPEMDGYEVCRLLKNSQVTRHIPVVFLTAKTTVEDEERGFNLGAVDFIHKPISPPLINARIKNHLLIKNWQDFLENKNNWLQQEVTRRLAEVTHLRDAAIYIMVSLAESRDEYTGNHIRRTQEYVRLLAEYLAKQPRYEKILTDSYIELLAKSTPLHDIGKIAIPDSIILKPENLTIEEFEIMKTHTTRGYEILKSACDLLGDYGEFLTVASQVAKYHHERWDGTGYPDGLMGETIPIAARLMAVADVYDVLRSRRSYKLPFTHQEATRIITTERSKQFDPDIVDAFRALAEQFSEIDARWPDSHTK